MNEVKTSAGSKKNEQEVFITDITIHKVRHLENRLLVHDLSGYSYDGIVESYFDRDKYSEIIKNKLEKYEQLVAQTERTEEEEEHI